ncbi:Uncharacterised protein [Chlamydia abortus]|nr:Uncharacterised protein [Chlamydia abortus]
MANLAPIISFSILGINTPGVSKSIKLAQLIHCLDFVTPGILPTFVEDE